MEEVGRRCARPSVEAKENHMPVAHRNRRGGFTLVELMIVVAIIGALSAVAIPSFINYQLTAKRAEAFANLGALVKTQKTYYAEFNTFVPAAPEPGGTTSVLPGTQKRSVVPLTAAMSGLGWTPEGDVYFDYDTVVDGYFGCSCATCFTATAYGNLDGDSLMSEVVYFHPDAGGGWCGVGVGGHGPPADPITGLTQWDMIVRHPLSDFY
jgi:type IV pilus assembly protein PilA